MCDIKVNTTSAPSSSGNPPRLALPDRQPQGFDAPKPAISSINVQ